MKFFRKIRQNLLSEGKIEAYFKYAIGEVILVVVGILIALQINIWNVQSQKNKRLKVYTQSLVEDLELDLKRLVDCFEFDSAKVITIQELETPFPYSVDSLNNSGLLGIFSIKPNNYTFKTMTSNNDLVLFNDLALQNLIMQYYAETDNAIRFENFYINNGYSNFIDYIIQNPEANPTVISGYLNIMASRSRNESYWYQELIKQNKLISKELISRLNK